MGRGSNLSLNFLLMLVEQKGAFLSRRKGALLSTKGALLSLTKDRKGALLSTKSATLRITFVLLGE